MSEQHFQLHCERRSYCFKEFWEDAYGASWILIILRAVCCRMRSDNRVWDGHARLAWNGFGVKRVFLDFETPVSSTHRDCSGPLRAVYEKGCVADCFWAITVPTFWAINRQHVVGGR